MMIVSLDSINRKISRLKITVANGRYDVSHLPRVRISQSLVPEAQAWCQKNYQDDWVWFTTMAQTDHSDFYFMHEQDAVAFSLRFGGVTD